MKLPLTSKSLFIGSELIEKAYLLGQFKIVRKSLIYIIMTSNLSLLSIALILALFSSCKVDPNDLNDLEVDAYEAEFAVPLFQAEVTLDEILMNVQEDTEMIIDPDGTIRLRYKGDVLGRSSQDIFDIVAALVPISVIDTIVHETYDIPGSIDIDFINLSVGQASVAFKSPHEEDVQMTLYIPQLIKDGEIFSQSFDINYTGSVPIDGGRFGINLAGYTLKSEGDTLITVRYEAYNQAGDRVKLDDFIVLFTNLEYSYAEGFLGTDVYTVAADTIEIDFFNSWANGSVYFEDPRIRMTVFNSFGFPIDADFLYVDVETVNDGVLPLMSPFIDDGIRMNYPALSEVGQTAETVFDFSKDNSNIREVLGAGPLAVYYDLEAIPNPNIDTSVRGFLTDSSLLRVQMEVELPIQGYADHFIVFDTFDLDLTDYDTENVNYVEFKLITENETPLGVDLQLYFIDSQNTALDSLLTPSQIVLESADVDEAGNSFGKAEKIIYQEYSAERFNKIKQAEKVVLKSDFTTTNQELEQSVKILAGQSVAVRMGMKIGVSN